MAKPSWQWVEGDLLQMKKDKTQESLYLEFKRADSLGQTEKKKDDISKDVSAFANSDGGDIIYGIIESGKSPSTFDAIDAGIDHTVTSPDWLEQIINSRIQPRIQGIRITPIELTTTVPGKYVYAVNIPASQNAPHQAYDKKYYKRYNFQSIPMEDYEVRDVRNRRLEPIVVAEIKGKRHPEWDTQGNADVHLSILLKNIGQRMAQRVYFECDLPEKYLLPGVCRFTGKAEALVFNGITYRNLRYHYSDVSGLLPLFPNTDCEVLDGNNIFVTLRMNKQDTDDSLRSFIRWIVYADGAEPTKGQISIGEIFGLQ